MKPTDDYCDEMPESDEYSGNVEFTESDDGEQASYRWAQRYDELNGAPEDETDC